MSLESGHDTAFVRMCGMYGLKRLVLQIAAVFLLFGHCEAKPQGQIVYIPFSEARPFLEELAEILPPDLKQTPPGDLPSFWPQWVARRDEAIRARLALGDEDTVVNFMVFGTSFTHAPRFSLAKLDILVHQTSPQTDAVQARELLEQRVSDLLRGISAPGRNERLLFARDVLARAGSFAAGKPSKLDRAREFLLSILDRVLTEHDSFQQVLAAARSLGDPTEEFAERSKLFKERGLSLDTSLLPDYALEVALQTMRDRGILKRASVRRVGVIGPGLDFTDKQEGYDFYPLQTVQPFAVLDSLLRLGLAELGPVEIYTLDLSPRVNQHIERAQRAGQAGHVYTIQLPRNPARHWTPGALSYWQHFGDRIGGPVPPVPVPPALSNLAVRAVRVRPEIVQRLSPLDVDIVLQREDVRDDGKFDLLVATNVLVYYDTFEQTLALANVQAMLRPGGFLLTNNLLLELPSSKMKGSDYVSVAYSDREVDGDRIVWYLREP
jgi:hypothetical protein